MRKLLLQETFGILRVRGKNLDFAVGPSLQIQFKSEFISRDGRRAKKLTCDGAESIYQLGEIRFFGECELIYQNMHIADVLDEYS